jgi:hypothetical protein
MKNMLTSVIDRLTGCDASAIAEEVRLNFFDDKEEIINVLLKPISDAEAGRLLRYMLRVEINDSIKEAEFDRDNDDDTPELNRMLFDRNEAR